MVFFQIIFMLSHRALFLVVVSCHLGCRLNERYDTNQRSILIVSLIVSLHLSAHVAADAYLGLHHAALSGNVGLVQYALSEGQPVDAVWDGISALHAAAAGGSEHVARLLIDSGADVNFGR